MKFDSSIFPYQIFDKDTIFTSVRGPRSACVFLWIIIQYRLAVFKFGRWHSLICDESLYKSCLQGSDHSTDLRLGIIFIDTGHFVRLWVKNSNATTATSPLPDIRVVTRYLAQSTHKEHLYF
jgi:hypothetical protein